MHPSTAEITKKFNILHKKCKEVAEAQRALFFHVSLTAFKHKKNEILRVNDFNLDLEINKTPPPVPWYSTSLPADRIALWISI